MLPKISITFKEAASTFIERTKKGVLAIILKDENVESGIYSLFSEEDITGNFAPANSAYIKRGFVGAASKPRKMLLCVIGSDEEGLQSVLKGLETMKFDYLVLPHDVSEEEKAEAIEWVKKEREAGHRVKGVFAGAEADCEGIINFGNSYIKSGNEEFSGAQFVSRIAGLLCGTPINESATYSVLSEVDEVDPFTKQELSAAVKAGKLVLFHDGEKVKVASGVTSLTSEEGISVFKKIKIVEAADMIVSDISKTAEDTYIGKFTNSYDNKCVLIVAINAYFAELVREGILKSGASCEIDVEAQRAYLVEKGIDVSLMSEQEIKEADTGECVFLKANVGILDAIENIALAINL